MRSYLKVIAIVCLVSVLQYTTASSSPGPHTRKQRLTQAIDDAHNGRDNFDLNTNGKNFGEYMNEDKTTGQHRAHVPWKQGEFPGQDLDKLPEGSLCTTDDLTGCRMHQAGNKLHHVDAGVSGREFYNPKNHQGQQPGVPQSATSGGILQRRGRPGHWDDLDKFAKVRRNSYGNDDGTGDAIFAMHKKDGKWRGAYRGTKEGESWKPFNTEPIDIHAQGPSGYDAPVKKTVASSGAYVPPWKRKQMEQAASSSSTANNAPNRSRSRSRERRNSVGAPREEQTRGRSRTRDTQQTRATPRDRSENRRGRSPQRSTRGSRSNRERAPSRPRGRSPQKKAIGQGPKNNRSRSKDRSRDRSQPKSRSKSPKRTNNRSPQERGRSKTRGNQQSRSKSPSRQRQSKSPKGGQKRQKSPRRSNSQGPSQNNRSKSRPSPSNKQTSSRSKSPIRQQPRATSLPRASSPKRSNSQDNGARKNAPKKSGGVVNAIKSCFNCGKKRK